MESVGPPKQQLIRYKSLTQEEMATEVQAERETRSPREAMSPTLQLVESCTTKLLRCLISCERRAERETRSPREAMSPTMQPVESCTTKLLRCLISCERRSMLRRPAGKMLVLLLVGLSVCGILIYEGKQLTGGAFRQKLSGYNEALDSAWALPMPAVTRPATPRPVLSNLPPAPTPVWQNPIYAERRHLSENVCSKVREGKVERLTRYGNISYCVVPKVGCTFWINVFRFLHRDTGSKNYTSPFDIPRIITHYGGRKSMKYFSTNNTFAPPHLVGDLRFMFVRDPYSRLWSAYVDKFLLIDYWRTAGKAIVSLRKKKDNMTKCARDISFKEFVEFVSTRQSSAGLNEHWKPIQYQCSPCLYHPHVIGKIETFSQDSRYVLQLMNSSWILDSYDHEHHIYQEMSMLITYNFHVLKSSHYTNCTNATDLSRRLWKTFQINGYLPMEMDFPDQGPAGINASRFQALAFEAYRTRPSKSPAEWKEQRVKAMQDAFKDISTETLQKIKNIYKIDFELFGYDPEPAFIFAGRKSSSKS